MIYANVELTVEDRKCVANKNIVLYRGDKNVEIRFVIKGNRFTVLDSTYAQMIIRRPSATSVFSDPVLIQNDTVVFTISEDMIDELKEIGSYTFQVRLYDNSMNARATLPPCEGCLIINQPIATEGEALVNAAMINDSAVLAAAYSDVPEDEIFDNNNAYNRTVWVDGDIITDVRMNKIENALYYINEKGGGGTATAPYISTSLPETVMVGSGEDFELDLDFSSPNLGKGTLKVFINDVDSMNTKIDQGMSITTIPGSLFSKGTNMVVIYVLDRVGMMSNSLTFYIRYGGTEVTSTFDAYTSYDYGATVRYYFTPTALDTSLQLTFYMEIDGVTQAGVPCTSDVRSYYTFPTNLDVGNHYCRAWVTDGTTRSNVLAFNLIILDATSLVVATDTLNPTVEEGTQLVLDYKVYMKNNTSFITKTYVDNNLINTGTCTLETAYYRSTNLTAGTHTIKVEVFDVTETYSDFVTWTVTVTESTYTMLEPATAGSTFIATAYNKSNVDENRDIWVGSNQDNQSITANLSNFSFNSENGWIDDALVISGNSWVEIPIQPLANNARYGFTLDIEFKTKAIGVEDAEVLTLWNETDNCGIKITTEQLIMRSKTGNQCDLYFAEDEIVSAIFVIDRDEKTAKIYLNGVMCEAFALSDYEAAGQKFLEDFTVNSNVYLGGYNKNGYCAIKNIRIYEVALATNEILNNFMSNEKDKAAQRALVEFQKGNTLPTLTIYCDFAGLGKDDKKPCNIVYNSPDVNLYGESFTLDGKHSMLQYQGTSSMQYPIKNYRINPRNADGKVKLDPFNNGVGESRFTLKADFMSSGHWQNTGLAKWVNDKLYNYNVNDESTMNARKWHDLQNGGSLKGTRESINGFPCRLILVNDGETALNEGQQEPTPGNTKDMGIFNFNNDKDNVETLGFDTDIFPNCMSFEVTANSDTSAGAFVPYEVNNIGLRYYTDWKDYMTYFLPIELVFSNGEQFTVSANKNIKFECYDENFEWQSTLEKYTSSYTLSKDDFASNIEYIIISSKALFTELTMNNRVYSLDYIGETDEVAFEVFEGNKGELEYLQNSFELRYPDADDVGGDYGYLGMEADELVIDMTNSGTTRLSVDYFGTSTFTFEKTGDLHLRAIREDGSTGIVYNVTTCTLAENEKHFQVYGGQLSDDTITINGVKYYLNKSTNTQAGTVFKDPYVDKAFSQDYGLKRVIDWVGNCTDEQFVAEFDQYFHRDYTLRYYLLVITLGMVDNLGKNMMFDTFDGKIWLPRFYDMDTICSYDNSGEIKFDVDIEMEQGYWNTSSSRLWTKIRDLMHDELVEKYNNMRQNGMSYESFMSYFYDKQIAQIPQTYYNKDYDVKYAPYADEYMGKAHGDGYEHLKRWLKRRLIFTDTLFDYAPSYTNDALTIRANTLDLMSLEIETYTPVYQHVSFYNGNMEKIKIDGKTSTVFEGTAQTATDQEVLIYGGSNIKAIRGIQSMNPNSMLIGNATRLTELDLSDCPILTVVNSNKANFSPHTYLNKLDISNCPQLGGTLNVSNSPLLQEVNALGSAVDNILFPTSVRNLETLRVPKTVTSLTLNDAGLLYTLEMEEGNNLQTISLTNCNNLTETINFDLTQVPTVLLDNSYNGEELYMSDTTNLTLKNMPSLKRVIFTPNSEYSAFDINNVLNGANYKITTFNNPMMTDFITTAPHRVSYNNGEYGDITPNTAFTANTLDLADTQFQNVKFLCTTDVYNLKVPTTMKNFYCDSAMDIDTDVIEDASYEVIHEELIEPYTTNYEGEVHRYKHETVTKTIGVDGTKGTELIGYDEDTEGESMPGRENYYGFNYTRIVPGSTITIPQNGDNKIKLYDENKVYISGSYKSGNAPITYVTPNNAHYFRFSSYHSAGTITYISGEPYTPNIIPSSANGSLIFNMYSNNTTQPTSTSPYMWDLTGLKLEDFYTYGMNNWVKEDWRGYNPTPLPFASYVHPQGSVGEKIEFIVGLGNNDKSKPSHSMHCLRVKTGETYVLNKDIDGYYYYAEYWGTTLDGTLTFIKTGVYNNTVVTVPNNTDLLWIVFDYHVNDGYVDKEWNYLIGNGKYWWANPSTDYTLHWDDIQNMTYEQVRDTLAIDPATVGNAYGDGTIPPRSITMPQRMPGYSVRLVNADITPDEYPTMLYPKLIDTTLPITGKLDYTKYNGTSLAWAYAYTTGDVSINPLDSRSIGQIEFDYNKLYGTDFVDVVDVWVYKDTDVSKLSTNEAITKAYIELTSANYINRIDDIMVYYPNCTDIYLFDDGSVTTLEQFLHMDTNTFNNTSGNLHTNCGNIKNVTFIEGYFNNLTSLQSAFRCSKIVTCNNIPSGVTTFNRIFALCAEFTYVSNIPNGVTNLNQAFYNCPKLTTVPAIPQGVTDMGSTFYGCTSLTTAPVIPDSVTALNQTFQNCTSLTTVTNIPTNCTNFDNTFGGCSNLTSVPTDGWKGNMQYTFAGCKINQQINISSATNLYGTFQNCATLTIPPSLPATANCSMQQCFQNCTSLTQAPTIPNGVTNMNACFKNNINLLTAPNIPESVYAYAEIIYGCKNITSITLPLTNVTAYGGTIRTSGVTDVTWQGLRSNNFDLTLLTPDGATISQQDIQELVPEHLADLSSQGKTATLTLGETYGAYLTPDEVLSANQKGWTIVGASSDFTIVNASVDVSTLTTDELVLSCFIELTSANYRSRIDEVLQWYPNCTDLYLFDDGSVTSLSHMITTIEETNNQTYKGQIQKVIFIDGYFENLKIMKRSFNTLPNLVEVDLNGIKGKITDFQYTFVQCRMLETVKMDKLDLSKLYDVSHMFFECLKFNGVVDFSNSPLTTYALASTFRGCNALTITPKLPSNISNGQMSGTFYGCTSLTTPPAIPQGVTNMLSTFYGCTSLTTPPAIPSSVTNMGSTFQGCTALINGAILHEDVVNTGHLYSGCSSLETIQYPLTNSDGGGGYPVCQGATGKIKEFTWTGERKTNLSVIRMFDVLDRVDTNVKAEWIQDLVPEHLADLTELGTTATLTLGEYASYLSFGEIMSAQSKGWTIEGDFSSGDYAMVNASTNLSETNSNITMVVIELTSSNYTSRINQVLQYYPNCTDLIFFDDGSVTSLYYMMSGVNTTYKSQIKTVEFLDGYFDKLTDIENAFRDCSALTTVPAIPNGVTTMKSTFQGCTSLTTAPVIPAGVTNMQNTFLGCSSLTTAPAIPQGVTNMYSTFQSCSLLTQAPTIPDGVTDMYSTFYNCTSLTTVPNIPSSVEFMESTFQNCSSLTTVPTIPSSVTDMGYTFYGCKALTQGPKISSTSITDIKALYSGCTNLQSCDVPIYVDACTNALYNVPSTCDITWLGERTTDLNVTSKLNHKKANATDIQELVPEHLADLTTLGTTATLTLGSTYLAYLTEDEIAQAVAKGWTIQ